MKNGKFLWPWAAGIAVLALALLFTACPDPTGSTEDKVDKSGLNSAITEAEAAKANVFSSTNGAELNTGDKWVTPAALTTFNTAINTANGVKNNASASQAQVDSAVTTLKAAITVFKNAISIKTDTDTVALNTSITQAQNRKNEVNEATDRIEVPDGEEWATAGQKDTLQAAITTATNALTAATQTEVDNAKTTLDNALSDFNTAVSGNGTGTKTNFTQEEFNGLITNAKGVRDETVPSTNGDDVPPADYWVTPGDLGTLNAAITIAEAVPDYQNSDYENLSNALKLFKAARQYGSDPALAREALQIAIGDAEDARERVTTDNFPETNDDAPPGSEWVTQDQWNALNTPYGTAVVVKNNNNATKNMVTEAKDTLSIAVTTFTNAISSNGLGSEPDRAALETAIANAEDAMKDVVPATDADEVPKDSKWVLPAEKEDLETAISAAVAIKNDNAATKNEVAKATSDLTEAIETFTEAIKLGTAVNGLKITGLGTIYNNDATVYIGVLPTKEEFDPSSGIEGYVPGTVSDGSLTISLPDLANGSHYSGFSSDLIIVFISKTAADFNGVPISIPYNVTNFEPYVWSMTMGDMGLEGSMTVDNAIATLSAKMAPEPIPTYTEWKNFMLGIMGEHILGDEYANTNFLDDNIAMYKDVACSQEFIGTETVGPDTVLYTKYSLAAIMEKAMAE
jgi:hypothetical protein